MARRRISAAASPESWRPKPSRPKFSREAGFTLIELLVCLVLLAVITGIVVPRFTAGPADTLARRAAEIAGELGRLRQTAIGNGTIEATTSAALGAGLPQRFALEPVSSAEIVFFPDGTTNGAEWRLAADGATLTIATDWLTGRITVDAP